MRELERAPAQNPTLQAARQLQTPQAQRTLRAMTLRGEHFWAGKSEGDHLARLFVESDSGQLVSTGKYAQQNVDGAWEALEPRPATTSLAEQHVLDPAFALDIPLQGGIPAPGEHAAGVTFIGSRPVVRIDGKVYQVQYDARIKLWHVVDPANPFAFFGRKPIVRGDDGQWRAVEPNRLRGGAPGKFAPLRETPAGPSTAVGGISDYELPADYHRYLLGIVSPPGTTEVETTLDLISPVFSELF